MRPALTTTDQLLAGTAAPGFEEIGELAAENRENLRELIANLKDMTQGLKEGRGTIGKLINSDELHQEAVGTLKGVQQAVIDAKNEIKRAGDNFQKVTDNVREGKGPIGKLLNDEKMAGKLDTMLDNIEKSSKNIKDITDKINNGKSTLSRLINDEEMGEQLKAGDHPDPRIMRPETADILIDAYRS